MNQSSRTTLRNSVKVVVVSDQPTCGVTSPPIRGRKVTLSCSMSYNRNGDDANLKPGATLSASMSWESAAGTIVSNSSTSLPNDAGETLRVDVQSVVTGAEIPSCNCTTWFHFTDKPSAVWVYALNSLSWTCSSKPVLTWCKFITAVCISVFH